MDEFLHLSASADLLGLGTKFDVVLLDPPWEESASHRWDRTEEADRGDVARWLDTDASMFNEAQTVGTTLLAGDHSRDVNIQG